MSPYLRSFVVSRINPLRWIEGDLPPADKVLTQDARPRREVQRGEVVTKQDDLARMGGGVPDEEG